MNNKKQLVETQGEFRLYKNSYNQYEIWFSNSFMGYVSSPENFWIGIEEAKEEIRCLMAESV